MKLTKPLMLAALVAGSLFAGNLALQAQDATNTPPPTPPAGGPPMRGQNAEHLATVLNLTDDQKPKVKSILDSQMQQFRDLRQDTSLTPEDRRAKMKTIREGTAKQLKDVLTPDQFKKWQDMNQHGRRPSPPPAGGNTNPPANPQQ